MPRLVELLARNLGVSKTAAARLIDDGRVTRPGGGVISDKRLVLNGDATTTPAAVEVVVVDDRPVSLWESALVLLHKPVGVVTALRDARHDTAYRLLEEAPLFAELRPVGRLDLDSSGLLLWTTDGHLLQRLTHPKRRVPRTYQAALAAPFRLPDADLVLEDGHRPEIGELREISRDELHPALVVPAGTRVLATVTIVGGAYHEVRRLFVALGSHVLGLARTRFGQFSLPEDLSPGGWRRIDDARDGQAAPAPPANAVGSEAEPIVPRERDPHRA